MSLSFPQIRSAVATQITNLGGGLHLAKVPAIYIGRIPNTILHKVFSVDIRSTSETADRMRAGIIYLNSTVEVRFVYRLRPKDVYPVDYDGCLTLEQQIINAVLGDYSAIQSEMQIRYIRSLRDIDDSLDYMIVSLEFRVLHTIPN